jgi:hypothetical protein
MSLHYVPPQQTSEVSLDQLELVSSNQHDYQSGSRTKRSKHLTVLTTPHWVTPNYETRVSCLVHHITRTDIQVIQFSDYENRGGSQHISSVAFQPSDAAASPTKFHQIQLPGMLHMIFSN